MGEMSQLSVVEAQKVVVGSLLWWPDCSLLWWWGRSAVELLLLILRVTAPILLLLRSVQLTSRWGIHHTVLRRSTARTTTDRGSNHHPLPLLLLGLNNSLHRPLLINCGTHQVIVGQVG
jgi:hypothetical protein